MSRSRIRWLVPIFVVGIALLSGVGHAQDRAWQATVSVTEVSRSRWACGRFGPFHAAIRVRDDAGQTFDALVSCLTTCERAPCRSGSVGIGERITLSLTTERPLGRRLRILDTLTPADVPRYWASALE